MCNVIVSELENLRAHCGYKRESGFEKTRGNTIVAVELYVVEGRGDAMPSGHGGRLVTLDMGPGGQHNTAVAHRLANEHHVDLDGSSNG